MNSLLDMPLHGLHHALFSLCPSFSLNLYLSIFKTQLNAASVGPEKCFPVDSCWGQVLFLSALRVNSWVAGCSLTFLPN